MCTLDERYLRRVGGGEAESVDGREQMMAIAGGSEGEREPAGARYGVRRIWIPQSQHTVDSGEYTEGIDRRLGGWSSGRDEVAAVWLSRPETERNSALGGGGRW